MTVWEQVLSEIRALSAKVDKLIEAQEKTPAATEAAAPDLAPAPSAS